MSATIATAPAPSQRGVPEFEFNLALGREVLAALLASGFSRSLLIGESGPPIGLRERTAIAERAGAREQGACPSCCCQMAKINS